MQETVPQIIEILRILSLEYLIEIKGETFREKDRLMLAVLKQTLKEREKNRKT
jgi:hypothetical protein